MEVVLSHAESDVWSCRISLRLMFDANGLPVGEPQVIPFGNPLIDAQLVEKRLLQAQRAILHLPLINDSGVEDFLTDEFDVSTKPPEDFSRNVVRLEVSGPDLVDVTFIDLPGIISNANRV